MAPPAILSGVNLRSVKAFEAFKEAVTALGGIVLEESWKGVNQPHRVRCPEGHEAAPRPNHVREGVGICRACSGRDPVTAWRLFRTRVEAQGGTVLEESWKGSQAPHRVRCSEGHEAAPRPSNVAGGGGVCAACSGRSAEYARKSFLESVAASGGVVLEGAWKGVNEPHRVRCVEGHEVTPTPGNVHRGQGVCRVCANRVYDVFYVVAGNSLVKFGISSGDPKARLADHKRAGLDRQLFLRTGLPQGMALSLEGAMIHALNRAGHTPVQGREYFPDSCTDFIVGLVHAALPD